MLISLFLFSVTALTAEPMFTATVGKADVPAGVSAAIRKELDTEAISIADKEGNTAIKLWYRSVIPMKATAEQVRNGLTYREMADGTLIGVIQFDKPFVDFRKQDIKAGVYTIRFAVQPDTGDHTGTAPHMEFLLLVPVEQDAQTDAVDAKTLVNLSTKVIGGDHPAVMLLFPQNAKTAKPTVVSKADGVQVITAVRKVATDTEDTTLGFAITIAGFSKTR